MRLHVVEKSIIPEIINQTVLRAGYCRRGRNSIRVHTGKMTNGQVNRYALNAAAAARVVSPA
jgi:hypothetical protein